MESLEGAEAFVGTPDSRTETEHDCDRIVYSDWFRRLGGVTQVVATDEVPLFHTRLTHTLKVQQLSRRIAEHLYRANGDQAPDALPDASAAEAAGMAHDLGHPPFGHIAEKVLDKKCVAGGLDGFEGNAQSFRILTKLARHRAAESGLGISDRTLRAVIKYPWRRSGTAGIRHDKWNAYPTEAGLLDRLTDGVDTQSVEASIMDWADDITYAVHDTEDFIRIGRIPVERLADPDNGLEREAFLDYAAERVSKKVSGVDIAQARQEWSSTIINHFSQLATTRSREEMAFQVRSASSLLIGTYVGSARLGPGPIDVPVAVRAEVEFLKQLTWYYVINDPRLASMQHGQEHIIEQLFEHLHTWLAEAETKRTMQRLPHRLAEFYRLARDEPDYVDERARQTRAVVDYIASLTEMQAVDLFERLSGVGAHSVTDPWLAF